MNPKHPFITIKSLLAFVFFCAALQTGSVLLADVPTPKPLWPEDKMQMTDIATYFRWTPIDGCTDYDIQIAKDASFNTIFKETLTKNVNYHEDSYFPKDILPTGTFYWRVRAMIKGESSGWSQVFSVDVNNDHTAATQVVRPLDASQPIFLMRARDIDVPKYGDKMKKLFPTGPVQVVIPDDISIWDGSEHALATAKKYDDMGIDFVVWNNRAKAPLSLLEYLFQNYKHCIGTAEGEHFWSYGWEKGPEGNISEWDYVSRAFILCGKYGRRYFIGDGEYGYYKWTVVAQDYKDQLLRYHNIVVPMYKTTVSDVALHSLGATEGLMVSGYTDNCGFWDDQFMWGIAHFGKLGEIDTHWSDGTDQCPPAFDVQTWLMGIASGSTVFQLESAHQWTGDLQPAENYSRFYLPFVQAVIDHHLIPSRDAFLNTIKVAVDCDYNKAKDQHHDSLDPDFSFLNQLYKPKHKPPQEIIPDNSRYGIVCLLPPGATSLNKQTEVVSQADLTDPAKVTKIFDQAYPQRFQGDAFMWECDGTVIITNSNENEDITQKFSMPFGASFPVQSITGDIAVHQYLIGKSENNGKTFWFQINGQDPARTVKLKFVCPSQPDIVNASGTAVTEKNWNDSTHELEMTVSYADKAADIQLNFH